MKQFRIALSAKINERNFRVNNTHKSIMIAEFPRSGANWLRDMLSDATSLPCPRFNTWPSGCDSILQTHTAKPINSSRVLYLCRDPRDVFLSHFYKAVNSVEFGNAAVKNRVLKFHPVIGSDMPVNQKMVFYFDEWMIRPFGSRVNWFQHTSSWLKLDNQKYMVSSYERLTRNVDEEFRRILEFFNYSHVNDQVIDFSIYKNSFEFKTGRTRGNADNKSNFRKAQAGAWVDDLPEALKSKFDGIIANYNFERIIDELF